MSLEYTTKTRFTGWDELLLVIVDCLVLRFFLVLRLNNQLSYLHLTFSCFTQVTFSFDVTQAATFHSHCDCCQRYTID